MSTQTSRTWLWIVAAVVSAVVLYTAAFMGSGSEPQQRSDRAIDGTAGHGAVPEREPGDLPPGAAAGETEAVDASLPAAGAPALGQKLPAPQPPAEAVVPPSPPPAPVEPPPAVDILPPTRDDTPDPSPKVPPSRDTGLIFTNKPTQEDKP